MSETTGVDEAGHASTVVGAGQLRRTLGFTDLTLIAVGTVIGSGIFLVPGVVLRETGAKTGLAMLVWVAAGILSYLGALTYAEMGAMKPDAGGLYTYIRDTFGSLPAFLYGWTSFFVIASGSIATLAVAFSGYFSQILPVGGIGARLISIAVIAVIAVVNVRGTRNSATVQNWTTGAKLTGLIALSVGLILLGHASSASWTGEAVWPASFSSSLLSGVGVAMIAVLWAYEGWQYVTFSAGETRDPQRTFPRAIIIATAALVALYVLANFGYVAALGPNAAAATDQVAADAARVVFGPTAARLVEHAWAEALEKQGLTHAGLIALHLLDAGPLSQTELAKRARVENQTMSRTIERLEREGFVARAADEVDRRRRVVTRTDAGHRVWELTRTLEAELFPPLGDPDVLRSTLLDLIRSSSDARWRD